jgi:hypothetical protein
MSTPAEGFDASFNKPSGADAAAANRKRAMLYITPPGTGNKGIDQAVWDDYTRHGIEIGFVWEEGTNAVQNGRAQGISDAKAAQAQLNALKGPEHDRPIYFAIDFDIQPGGVHGAGRRLALLDRGQVQDHLAEDLRREQAHHRVRS